MKNTVAADFLSRAVLTDDNMLEVENFSFEINPEKQFFLFGINNKFITKKQAAALMLWYLKADVNDTKIADYIGAYSITNIRKPFYNSNYGKYFFTDGGLAHCILELSSNKNSRRAVVALNNNKSMFGIDIDKVCTNAVMFRIRDNALNMTVHMRSNHLINNAPLDIFTFCMFYSIVYNELKLNKYKDLKIGVYHHAAASMHIHKGQRSILEKVVYASFKSIPVFNYSRKNWYDTINNKMIVWLNLKS